MSLPSSPSRHVHHTFLNIIRDHLDDAGWISAPTNLGTTPVTVTDIPPDDRGEGIADNTVAVTLGDVGTDDLQQLGGGLWAREYPIFVDIYGVNLSIATAIADDVRLAFGEPGLAVELIDQRTQQPVTDALCVLGRVLGPEFPIGAGGAHAFRRRWRMVRASVVLEFSGWPTLASS